MTATTRFPGRLAAAVPVLAVGAFMAVFFVWPLVGVVFRGFSAAGSSSSAPMGLLGPLGDVLGSASHRSVLWFTFWQAAASTALTVAAALPAAGAMARLRFRGQRLVRALTTVPFVLPTVVAAAAFEALFDRFALADGDGLRLRHTVWAILLAHVFFNYAVVLRTVGAQWSMLDTRVEDQARVLGASRLRVFSDVLLPRLAPSLAAASAIVFLFSFTSFGVVLVLGGPARATLETEIYRYAIARMDLTAAAALAVVQLGAVVALVIVSNVLERRCASTEPVSAAADAAPRHRHRGPSLVVNLAVMGVLLGLPIAVLIERSLAVGRRGGYSLGNYTELVERAVLLPDTALAAMRNSLLFAAPATALAVLVGGAATLVILRNNPPPRTLPRQPDNSSSFGQVRRWRFAVGRAVDNPSGQVRRWQSAVGRAADVGLTLPLGVSAVTIGLGFLLVLNRPPLDIRTSVVVVPIAHALVGIPFVVRTLVPMLRTVNPRLREAAAVLGASPRRVRCEVDLRVAARGVAVGAGFAFAVSLGEFGATSFIPRRPETLTAPLALFRLLGTPGEALRGQAMALAVALMALTAATVFVMDLWGDARRAGF